MVKVQVAECDWKGCEIHGKDVHTYVVQFPDGVLTADLCTTHSAPLAEMRRALPSGLFVKVRPGRRVAGGPPPRKLSPEEFEAEIRQNLSVET